MPNFAALESKKDELIRKATKGIVAYADMSVAVIGSLTTYAAGPPAVISFSALPTGYEDLGNLTSDGAQMSRDISQSTITSWGKTTPTRTDITADTTTVTVVPQETRLNTIALATGADPAGFTPAANTGELSIIKPTAPTPRSYRLLVLALDLSPLGKEIVIGRFFPRAKVTSFAQQNLGGGDNAIEWGVTFTAEYDSTAAYSERWLFAGAGWNELLATMGFDV